MIGIISAMPEEIKQLMELSEGTEVHETGKRKYYIGRLWGKKVVMAYSRIGKVAAATTAVTMILNHNVENIIFTGVAGSISPDIEIGDIVIGKRLIQHDLDASPIFPQFEVPLLDKKFFEADKLLSNKLYHAAQRFTENIDKYISREDLKKFRINHPQIFRGDIASGDQFISDMAQQQRIKDILPSVLCVEMEGAAVAQVCYEYDIPFAVLRTISDNADHNADIDFNQFLHNIAEKYSMGILENFFANL